MLNKLSIWILITSILFLGVAFLHESSSNQPYIELLYEVESIDEATSLSMAYGIELLDYSVYGFATYSAPKTLSNDLIDLGFVQNHHLSTLAPPWKQPLSDPFVNNQYAIAMLDLTNAWQLSEGSSEIMIAIIDSGIDTDHEEFVGRISPLSYNSRTNLVGLSHVEDDSGHGTAVAGVIGAIKGNQKGIAGIIQHASLLIIKANNEDNSTTEVDESSLFSDSSIIEGIRYATAQGADIINLSLGGKNRNSLVENAIRDAREAGVIIVASSGNFTESNPDTGVPVNIYPASYEGVISVGSINSNQILSTFSMYSDMLDVVAPGESIVTTGMNNTYITASGTSFSAPMVSGVIGLMISYLEGVSDDDIMNKLINTATDLGIEGYDIYHGNGLIDAYQAMLVNFVTVSFETNGGTLISDMNVAKDISFYVNSPTKTGYTFEGWYLDSLFTQPFEMGVETISSPITLYAQFLPNSYTVTYVTEGSPLNSETVLFDQLFTPSETELIGHDFIGWYLEETFDTLYTSGTITGDLVLYAKFVPKQFTITYMVSGLIDQTETFDYHDIPNPYAPEYICPFIGWYVDESLVTPYEPIMIESDLILYARFDDRLYKVTFFDSDLISVLKTEQVYYGQSVEFPHAPMKPSSPSFDYIFSGWDVSSTLITKDTNIYPTYTMLYKPESIMLNPGIDTVIQGLEHHDAGITVMDQLLKVHVTSNIDIEIPGRYVIRYDVIYQEDIIDIKYRIVHITLPTPQVEIIFNPDVTTLKVGEEYVDSGVVVNHGTVTSSGVVDTNQPGIYEITYIVNYMDVIYQKTKRVHVLDETDYDPQTVLFFDTKKEVWYR